jgi:class 3 adenylate cyclase
VGLRSSRDTRRRLTAWLISLALAAGIGSIGLLSDYNSPLPALGGPNGLLYDLTLRASTPWRQNDPTIPVVLVAVDEESLAAPELAALPRAMFQPVWARLIDGVMEAGARRLAFDIVFAYAAADFRAGAYTLPDYDQPLLASLTKYRDRIVVGRFPGIAPAASFSQAVGAARIGVLDLQVESDGRVRSAAPLAQLDNGRIAVGFAALGAGLNIRQASALQRILIAPTAPLADTPTYRLATLLDCLASPDSVERVRQALAGRVVVVGTTVLGEDEHRGPTRFMGAAGLGAAGLGVAGLGVAGLGAAGISPGDRCAPQSGLIRRAAPEAIPGALLQVAAIQAAASGRPVSLAAPWLRFSTAAMLALAFAAFAFRDESAQAIGERDVSGAATILGHLLRSFAIGLAGPAVAGGSATVIAFAAAHQWLPMGYPILATSLMFAAIVSVRSARHRVLFKRLYQTAGRYLPPARLIDLARGGFSSPPEGQEREVSILLVDLVGFTAFSNQSGRTPSEVVRTANQYFTLMQNAIDRHGGCSDKFLGDAVLAFWNGLSDDKDHAARALATALQIIRDINGPSGAHVHAGATAHRLTVRAVVCTGKVYVGDLGAKQRSNFTIIGPAVNETFRLERVPDLYGLSLALAATTADAIAALGPDSAAAQVLDAGALVRIDDVDLKGFSGAHAVYAYVPCDDPGIAEFQAGRAALDRQQIAEGLAHLARVDGGQLQQAARVLSARHQLVAEAVQQPAG